MVMDAGKSFASAKVQDFLLSLNILPHYTAEKEAWSHGMIEASVQDVKRTASAIQLEALDQDPYVTMYLCQGVPGRLLCLPVGIWSELQPYR